MTYLTVTQAADKVGLTNVTIRVYIKRGLLTATMTPGGHWRIEEGALSEMMTPPRKLPSILT